MSNMHNSISRSASELIVSKLDSHFLTRGRVVLIGLGGIGLHLCRVVASFLAGLQTALKDKDTIRLFLCDGDEFTPGNMYRMDVPDFGNKAEVVGRELLEHLDAPGWEIRWRSEYATENNIEQIVQEGDCVLLACDNHATRQCLSRHCSSGKLANVILISGGNDGLEEGLRGTYGNVQVYVRRQGCDLTAPLDRFHPEIAKPADRSPHELSCLELAAAGVPQLAFVNFAVASAMCNALLRLLMPPAGESMYDEVSLDILDAVSLPHWVSGSQRQAP